MNDFIELRRVLAIISHRWWLLVVLPVIYGVLGFAASKTQTPVYVATTTLLAGEIMNATDLNRQDIAASDLMAITYKELIHRQPVMQGVVGSLGLNMTWQALRSQVSVLVVEGTQLLQITVEASSPQAAQRIADEVAYQLTLYSPTVFRNVENEDIILFVQQQLTNLQDRIESGHSRMAALESAMVTTTSADRLSELQAEAKNLEALIADWENNYTQLLIVLQSKKNLNKLTVIEAAQANPRPIRPRAELYVLVGVSVAVLLALGLIFLMEYLENTVKSPDEITRDFGLPVFGYIAKMKVPKDKGSVVYVSEYPLSPIAEAYRSLRAHLELVTPDEPLRKILVTSCDKGVGKTSVSANLAIIIGQGEKGVVLVDADLRDSNIHKLMGLPNVVGLSDVVRDGKEIAEAIQELPNGRVRVITGGTPTPAGKPSPFEVLGSKKMDKILAYLGKNNDVVILDSPPLIVSDALLLSTKVDGVLLVVQLGKTRRKYIRSMLEQLSRVNANVVGVVLNQMSTKDAQNFGEYFNYAKEYSVAQESSGETVDEEEDKKGLVQAGIRLVKSISARFRKAYEENIFSQYTPPEQVPEKPRQRSDEKPVDQVEPPKPKALSSSKKWKKIKRHNSTQPEAIPNESKPKRKEKIKALIDTPEPIPAADGQVSEKGPDVQLEGHESYILEIEKKPTKKRETQVDSSKPIPAKTRRARQESLDTHDSFFVEPGQNFIELASQKVNESPKE
ncbi:MAG TPA: polysaccharide biosynthesis tyrosine autokinase [Anaerolineales bacterium]|nr:polysaccharide biosynthesis tyrosine autokinase [Anaerolineales bacterium]